MGLICMVFMIVVVFIRWVIVRFIIMSWRCMVVLICIR